MTTMMNDPAETFGMTLLTHVALYGGTIESVSQMTEILGFNEFQMKLALNWCVNMGLLEELPGKEVEQ